MIGMVNVDTQLVPATFYHSQQAIHASNRVYGTYKNLT
jgi:hypothetical protein